MNAKRFLDTNLFIYQLDQSDPSKSEIADQLIRDAVVNDSGCISYQVIQECLHVFCRTARVKLTPAEATTYLDHVLAPLLSVRASIELYRHALSVQTRYRFGFYDSLIVAGALEAGCDELTTENMRDGQRIESLIIRNPFVDLQ